MKKRVFIIHGWEGSPDEPLFRWIRNELEKSGYEVIAPQMPNPDLPVIDEWVPFLAEIVGRADENTNFIGHSIGCQAILRYLETIAPQRVGQLVFIAGWFHLKNLEDEESETIARSWQDTSLDLAKVRATTSNITVILSDDDPFVPLSDKDIFERELGAKVIVEKGKGHFTEGDGVREMGEVVEKLLSPANDSQNIFTTIGASEIEAGFGENDELKDEYFLELLDKAYVGKIKCRKAVIKMEAIHPFTDFQPDISAGFREYFARKTDEKDYIFIAVYQKDGKFIMSDDYNAFSLYKEMGTDIVPCIVFGEINDMKDVVNVGKPFKLETSQIEVVD